MLSIIDAGATLAGKNTFREMMRGWMTGHPVLGRFHNCSAEMRLKKWLYQLPSAGIWVPEFHGDDDRGLSLLRMDPDHAVWCFSFTDAEDNGGRSMVSLYVITFTVMNRGYMQEFSYPGG